MMRQTVDEPKRSKTPYVLGCCGGGCLVAVIAVIGGIWWTTNFVASLQEPTPTVKLEPVDQPRLEETENRYEEYKQRVDSGKATATDEFVLTEAEINNALSSLSEGDKTAPRVQVRLDGTVATGAISFPIPQDDGTQKWVNGEAEFTVTLSNGKLDIRLKRLNVRGKDIPESFMEGFKKENLAKDINNDPKFKNEIDKIESIEIKDSKVYVKLMPATDSTPDTPVEETDDTPLE